MDFWLRLQTTTPLVGGKAGMNVKTKIPSHIRRKWPGACFSKVPKLFGPISGTTIPFISSQRRGSKLSNFAILLIFLILKACKKISFSKRADCSLTTSFSGPKSSRDVRETGPRTEIECMTYSNKRHEVSSQLTFPLYNSFCFSVAWKLSVFIQRQSWMQKSFTIKRQFWIKLTSFLRQLPQCQAIFSEQFSLPLRRSQKWGFAN